QKAGMALEKLERWDEAGAEYRMNLETARNLDKNESTPETLSGLAFALKFLGIVEKAKGDAVSAEKSFREQLKHLQKMMEISGETIFNIEEVAQCWGNLAAVHILAKNDGEA